MQRMLHFLLDGTLVTIRPIEPEDKRLLVDGLRRLSPEAFVLVGGHAAAAYPSPFFARSVDAIATGTVKVNVSARYPLKDAAQAHRDLESRETVGSVVLTP